MLEETPAYPWRPATCDWLLLEARRMSEDVRWATRPFGGYSINRQPKEDEELTHVGPGTPCGEYMRRFWHPVAMSGQVEGKTNPVPIRILGEDLVVFRDLGGRVGLLHKHCAH